MAATCRRHVVAKARGIKDYCCLTRLSSRLCSEGQGVTKYDPSESSDPSEASFLPVVLSRSADRSEGRDRNFRGEADSVVTNDQLVLLHRNCQCSLTGLN